MESDHLRSEDLFPYDWKVTITRTWQDTPPKRNKHDKGYKKIFVQLKEFPKPWIMNIENGQRIAGRYGWDPAKWVGKELTIYAKEGIRQVGGGMGMGIRIRPIQGETDNGKK